jgi:diacylglycerol kinase family enzyme
MIAIIVNNKAQNASSIAPYLDALKSHKLSYQLFETDPEKLVPTVKQCLNNFSILLIGGGDGTIRTAAEQVIHTSIPIGVLPLGTLNHFAKELDLPSTPEEIIEAILYKKMVTVDTAEVNGLVFLNNSSLGFYPSFAKKRNYYTKFYNKWLTYFPSLVQTLKRHDLFSITIKSAKLDLSLITSFLMISNNLYTYQFPLTIQREGFNAAQLGIYFFKHGKLQLLKILRHFLNGHYCFGIEESKEPLAIQVHHEEKITISLDGDTVTTENPLIYKSNPQSLIVLAKS